MPSRFRYSLLGARFTRSCDVINYVTNRFAIGHLLVVHWKRSYISCRFQIFASKYIWVTILTFWCHLMLSVMWGNWPQTFWGHDLDLSRSRDVIGHVYNRFTIGHLLLVLVVQWYQGSVSKHFQDIRPQSPVRTHRHTHTRSKWFYILSHAMHCIGQTTSAISTTVVILGFSNHWFWANVLLLYKGCSNKCCWWGILSPPQRLLQSPVMESDHNSTSAEQLYSGTFWAGDFAWKSGGWDPPGNAPMKLKALMFFDGSEEWLTARVIYIDAAFHWCISLRPNVGKYIWIYKQRHIFKTGNLNSDT